MRKKLFVAICLFVSMSIVSAQKVTEGSLAFLKGVEELHFNFDYKGMMIKKQTEKQYVAEQVREKNKDKKGEGDEWKTSWETTDREYIQEIFLQDFNKEITGIGPEGGDFPNANYVATVKTIWLDPGYMAGPMTKISTVTVEVTITKTGSTKVLAKVLIKKAKGNYYDMANTYSTDARRIGSSYGEAGERLGKVIAKTINK
ncbi:MAG: hypothetical protein LBE13_19335 [Bacteroidales bacterium]|jgi:hypothetical protein|nr:hypothetical protein [Bacteroidales bacterium]